MYVFAVDSVDIIIMIHCCQDLVAIFNDLFEINENTILVGGADEPIYLPADDTSEFNRIFFTRDYFASALHEVAHWCLAGDARRRQIDYGYWYYPEGRNAAQQALFEQVEVKPQAIECLFSQAAGSRFIPSQDNFLNDSARADVFQKDIAKQVQYYSVNGLPPRAAMFYEKLIDFYSAKTIE